MWLSTQVTCIYLKKLHGLLEFVCLVSSWGEVWKTVGSIRSRLPDFSVWGKICNIFLRTHTIIYNSFNPDYFVKANSCFIVKKYFVILCNHGLAILTLSWTWKTVFYRALCFKLLQYFTFALVFSFNACILFIKVHHIFRVRSKSRLVISILFQSSWLKLWGFDY